MVATSRRQQTLSRGRVSRDDGNDDSIDNHDNHDNYNTSKTNLLDKSSSGRSGSNKKYPFSSIVDISPLKRAANLKSGGSGNKGNVISGGATTNTKTTVGTSSSEEETRRRIGDGNPNGGGGMNGERGGLSRGRGRRPSLVNNNNNSSNINDNKRAASRPKSRGRGPPTRMESMASRSSSQRRGGGNRNGGNNNRGGGGDNSLSSNPTDRSNRSNNDNGNGNGNGSPPSSKPAFPGAKFDSRGFCIHHPRLRLQEKIFDKWHILHPVCPRCDPSAAVMARNNNTDNGIGRNNNASRLRSRSRARSMSRRRGMDNEENDADGGGGRRNVFLRIGDKFSGNHHNNNPNGPNNGRSMSRGPPPFRGNGRGRSRSMSRSPSPRRPYNNDDRPRRTFRGRSSSLSSRGSRNSLNDDRGPPRRRPPPNNDRFNNNPSFSPGSLRSRSSFSRSPPPMRPRSRSRSRPLPPRFNNSFQRSMSADRWEVAREGARGFRRGDSFHSRSRSPPLARGRPYRGNAGPPPESNIGGGVSPGRPPFYRPRRSLSRPRNGPMPPDEYSVDNDMPQRMPPMMRRHSNSSFSPPRDGRGRSPSRNSLDGSIRSFSRSPMRSRSPPFRRRPSRARSPHSFDGNNMDDSLPPPPPVPQSFRRRRPPPRPRSPHSFDDHIDDDDASRSFRSRSSFSDDRSHRSRSPPPPRMADRRGTNARPGPGPGGAMGPGDGPGSGPPRARSASRGPRPRRPRPPSPVKSVATFRRSVSAGRRRPPQRFPSRGRGPGPGPNGTFQADNCNALVVRRSSFSSQDASVELNPRRNYTWGGSGDEDNCTVDDNSLETPNPPRLFGRAVTSRSRPSSPQFSVECSLPGQSAGEGSFFDDRARETDGDIHGHSFENIHGQPTGRGRQRQHHLSPSPNHWRSGDRGGLRGRDRSKSRSRSFVDQEEYNHSFDDMDKVQNRRPRSFIDRRRDDGDSFESGLNNSLEDMYAPPRSNSFLDFDDDDEYSFLQRARSFADMKLSMESRPPFQHLNSFETDVPVQSSVAERKHRRSSSRAAATPPEMSLALVPVSNSPRSGSPLPPEWSDNRQFRSKASSLALLTKQIRPTSRSSRASSPETPRNQPGNGCGGSDFRSVSSASTGHPRSSSSKQRNKPDKSSVPVDLEDQIFRVEEKMRQLERRKSVVEACEGRSRIGRNDYQKSKSGKEQQQHMEESEEVDMSRVDLALQSINNLIDEKTQINNGLGMPHVNSLSSVGVPGPPPPKPNNSTRNTHVRSISRPASPGNDKERFPQDEWENGVPSNHSMPMQRRPNERTPARRPSSPGPVKERFLRDEPGFGGPVRNGNRPPVNAKQMQGLGPTRYPSPGPPNDTPMLMNEPGNCRSANSSDNSSNSRVKSPQPSNMEAPNSSKSLPPPPPPPPRRRPKNSHPSNDNNKNGLKSPLQPPPNKTPDVEDFVEPSASDDWRKYQVAGNSGSGSDGTTLPPQQQQQPPPLPHPLQLQPLHPQPPPQQEFFDSIVPNEEKAEPGGGNKNWLKYKVGNDREEARNNGRKKPKGKINGRVPARLQNERQIRSVKQMPYTDQFGDFGMYSGAVNEDGRPHGKGSMKYENGVFYEGTWTDGCQDQQAASQYERIRGGFTSWQGKGKQGTKSGMTLPWNARKNDVRDPNEKTNVRGMEWTDLNGDSGRYTGEVSDERLPHGHGIMKYDFGLIAEGEWVNGVLKENPHDRLLSAAASMGGGRSVGGGARSVGGGMSVGPMSVGPGMSIGPGTPGFVGGASVVGGGMSVGPGSVFGGGRSIGPMPYAPVPMGMMYPPMPMNPMMMGRPNTAAQHALIAQQNAALKYAGASVYGGGSVYGGASIYGGSAMVPPMQHMPIQPTMPMQQQMPMQFPPQEQKSDKPPISEINIP